MVADDCKSVRKRDMFQCAETGNSVRKQDMFHIEICRVLLQCRNMSCVVLCFSVR